MSIERRHSPRVEAEMETQILHRGRCFSTRATNLSREGLFLQTDSLTIPSGMFIDISLSVGNHHWQMSGLVIWSCPKGIGVVFRISQPELYEAVRAMNPEETGESHSTPIQFPIAASG